jgi:GntR family transcriptional regulator
MLSIFKLEKESPIPLYYQLKERIKKEIQNGHLNHGDSIPSEREFVEVCEISRPTVRQALTELVSEGILLREKGRGTFVAKPKIDQRFLESLISFSKEMELKGVKHHTRVLKQEMITPDTTLTDIFGPDCHKLLCLERVRYVDGQPVVIVTSYIPADIAPGLEFENFEESSLYDLVENKYGGQISHAKRILESTNVSEEDQDLLEVEPDAAIHLIRTTAYLAHDIPFEYSVARYRGDKNSFTVTLKFRK